MGVGKHFCNILVWYVVWDWRNFPTPIPPAGPLSGARLSDAISDSIWKGGKGEREREREGRERRERERERGMYPTGSGLEIFFSSQSRLLSMKCRPLPEAAGPFAILPVACTKSPFRSAVAFLASKADAKSGHA